MPLSKIAGIGMYVPNNVVTNQDLTKYMETSDEWIQERTGIQERRYAHRTQETTTTMAVEAAKIALERAGTTAEEIDFIVFCNPISRLLLSRMRGNVTASHENEGNRCLRRT